MKESLALALALACAALAGCNEPAGGPPSSRSASPAEAPPPASALPSTGATAARAAPPAPGASPREGNTVARAGDVLFVADEDHSVVRVVSLPVEAGAERTDVATPGRPASLLTAGDRVLVTVRDTGGGSGALLVYARKGRMAIEEVGRVALPLDAWGLAISPDGKTALVTSAWTHKLSAIDLGTLKVRWSADVAREPRGITILPRGDRAYVSHLIGGAVTRVDGVAAEQPAIARVELPSSPLRSPYNVKLSASNGWTVTTNPAGDRVYFPRHALGALGPDNWFGDGAVDVMLAASETNAAPPRRAVPAATFTSVVSKAMETSKWMAGTNPAPERSAAFVEARAALYRKKTDTLLFASSGSDTLVEVDALAMDPTTASARYYRVGSELDERAGARAHGAAPQGFALSEDEDQAYVFCRGSDDLVVVNLAPEDGFYRIAPSNAVSFPNTDDKELVAGRQLFLNGANGHLSGGLACNSCHPEGRDDGFVWHEVTFKDKNGNTFTNFFAGTDLTAIKARWGEVEHEGEGGFGYARQTPMLAGRVKAKGPYGWHGESETLEARIMASFKLHRWNSGWDNKTLEQIYATKLAAFVREGLLPPPREERALTEEEARGKAIFESPAAQCSTCHNPAGGEYTDRVAIPLKAIKPPATFADEPNRAYKTPSLRYVGHTPPYLHDGRFESLESLIELNQDRMGKTSHLSADEKKALVAFLRTL
jgi:cytochrome c peroxidase